MNGLYALATILGVALIAVALLYNRLVARRQMVKNGWADIDVQLKRRADLVPQLVDVARAYAAHEQRLFEDVAQRRQEAFAAGDDPAKRAEAETALSRPVGRLVALAEAYPDLKADQVFLALQTELVDTEDKIEMARRFYNGAVRELNTLVETIPANFVAQALRIDKRAYFEIDAPDRAVAPVNLDRGP